MWDSSYGNLTHLATCFCLLLMAGCLIPQIPQKPSAFRTTTSPSETYRIDLKGGKGTSPPNIRADIYRNGQMLQPDVWLYSDADGFMPFEAAYRDVRWLSNNVVEFYRKEAYDKGTDRIHVENKASKSITYLHLDSASKLLVLDIQPNASVFLPVPAPKVGAQWIAVEGLFSDGGTIQFTSKTLDSRSSNHSSYEVVITDSEVIIEG